MKEKLKHFLEEKGYSGFTIITMQKTTIELDNRGKPFYEKNRLLYVFNSRLKGALENDPNNKMIPFLEDSIRNLKTINDKEDIYFWEIQLHNKRISGRCTEKQILHIYPGEDQ
jgi:hypothetical protein